MSSEDIKILIALLTGLGGVYALVTRPIQTQIQKEIAELRADLQKQISDLEIKLTKEIYEVKNEIHEVERRLNERIDAWIVRK